jgi:hypothetical protein
VGGVSNPWPIAELESISIDDGVRKIAGSFKGKLLSSLPRATSLSLDISQQKRVNEKQTHFKLGSLPNKPTHKTAMSESLHGRPHKFLILPLSLLFS